MEIIYGSELSQRIKEELKQEIEKLQKEGKRLPVLSVILVGDNPASQSYVKSKANACASIGMENRTIRMPGSTTQQELLEEVKRQNEDPEVDGILVQLPLPSHLDEVSVIDAISSDKDVDGLHPVNAGKLLTGRDGFVPCTPLGVMEMLASIGYTDLSGLNAVVIGRSNLVGKPLSLLLQKQNATVMMAHSITADYIKEGAVVIDVGINRMEDGKLCGDVDFEAVKEKTKAITPVPKGVGPMTVCMLLKNTLKAYKEHEKIYG